MVALNTAQCFVARGVLLHLDDMLCLALAWSTSSCILHGCAGAGCTPPPLATTCTATRLLLLPLAAPCCCCCVPVQAASSNRPSWFPGSKFPAHLDGSLPGDHGFDPFNLGVDPAKLKWCVWCRVWGAAWRNTPGCPAASRWQPQRQQAAHAAGCNAAGRAPGLTVPLLVPCCLVCLVVVVAPADRYQQAELVHCRFAMLGAAGILVPDLFHSIGLGGPAAQVRGDHRCGLSLPCAYRVALGSPTSHAFAGAPTPRT